MRRYPPWAAWKNGTVAMVEHIRELPRWVLISPMIQAAATRG